MTVHAPAEQIARGSIPRWASWSPWTRTTCILDTGAATVEILAVYLGLLGADFEVDGPLCSCWPTRASSPNATRRAAPPPDSDPRQQPSPDGALLHPHHLVLGVQWNGCSQRARPVR